MSLAKFEWYGDKIVSKVDEQIAKLMILWAHDVVNNAKMRVHRESGTLSRSLHAATRDYEGEFDEQVARLQPLPLGGVGSGAKLPQSIGEGRYAIVAGSWLSYAIHEFRRGGTHDYLTAPFTIANERFKSLMRRLNLR